MKPVRALLGAPEYARFFDAVRRRLEESGDRRARTVALPPLDARERSAVAGLLGWSRLPEVGERIPLEVLDRALRESSFGVGLREVLEALGGPLLDRPRERADVAAAWARLWSDATAVLSDRPELLPWLEDLRTGGLLVRVAASVDDAEALLGRAIEISRRLPEEGGVLLAVLASECTGDAHALDPGRPLAGLVLRAAGRIAGWPAVPTGAAERRRLWGEVGVLCDPLSSQVLVLGLRPTGDETIARQLREAADDGEPRRLTFRELQHFAVTVPAGTRVSICENPSIVAAAADLLGPRCEPLVCVEGQPSTAAVRLLRGLVGAGARLRFHADFDWAGIRVGNRLAELGATPWRYSAADYREALRPFADLIPLGGRPAEVSWDPGLASAMNEAGKALFEEQVMDGLLADLA